MAVFRMPAFRLILFVTTLLAVGASSAQSVLGAFQVGTSPRAIALDPVRNRVYVVEAEGLRVIDRNLGGVTTSTSGVTSAQALATNVETDTVYVSNGVPASWVSIFDGTSRSLVANTPQIGYGPLVVDTINDRVYQARSDTGAINVLSGRSYATTSSTRSPYASQALSINPTNHRLYSLPYAKDVVAMDMTSPAPYVPILCPDGAGGFRTQPPVPPAGTPETYAPCIDAWSSTSVINPLTNKIYTTYSDGIRVINGNDHTYVSVPLPGGAFSVYGGIAVNPVTNKVYVATGSGIAVVDGASNAYTLVPISGMSPTAVGINVLTNTIYSTNGSSLVVLDGTTHAVTKLQVGPAIGLVVDPLSNTVYILRNWSDETDSRGSIVVVAGAPGTAAATGIQTTITALQGDTTASANGTITLGAASSMTPAPFGTVRKVYYRLDPFGPWIEASGNGTYTAAFSGLARRAHTIQAFATNGLESPLAARAGYYPDAPNDVAHVPVVGNIASYTFTVTDPDAAPPPDLQVAVSGPPSVQLYPGASVTFSITTTNNGPGTAAGVRVVDTLPSGWTFASADPGCTHSSGVVTCDIGTMAQGATATRTVTGRPSSTGVATNAVSVSGSYPDETPGNNSASAQVDVVPPPPPIASAAQISAGFRHACVLTTAGAVQCWGDNSTGQLGDNTRVSRILAATVPGLDQNVTAVSAGGFYAGQGSEATSGHTCAITGAGGLKCWGANESGQLGDGTKTDRLAPVDVVGLTSGVVAVSAGGRHTCAITSAGGVKCWGANGSGELGDGTTAERLTPANVSGLSSGIVEVSATYLHTCALNSAGAVFCWGHNASGQLGNGTRTSSAVPVPVSSLASNVASISTGHGAALDSLYSTSVEDGADGTSCAVMTWGGAKCWGENAVYQLGDGSGTTDRLTPFDVYGLTSGVASVAVGDITNYWVSGIISTNYASSHTCALLTSGGVKCWGKNSEGQLGTTATGFTAQPVDATDFTSGVAGISAGSGYTCAIIADGGVRCWGRPDFSGVARTTYSSRVPQAIIFGAAPSVPVGGTGTVTATGGGSPNPIVFISLTPSVCSVSGSTVTGHVHEICTIAANQAGDSYYDAAPQVTQSFAIGGRVAQTITFGPAPALYVNSTATVSATSTSGNAVTFSSNTPSVCSVSGDLVTGLAAGMCTIAANAAGDSLYDPAPQTTQNITVSPAQSSLANLWVSQTRAPNPATAGKDLIFNMTVANLGQAGTGSVTLQDVLQSDAAFVWASAACSHASGTVTCNLGSLASGASAQVKIVVRPSVAGSLNHTVSVSGSTAESDTTNNTNSVTTTVNSTPVAAQVLRYRLYSDVTREHHFTTDLNEYTVLGGNGNWVQEGTVGKVLDNPGSFNGVAAVPYYRLYDTATRWHHWTTDANEYYTLIEFPNWNAEGVDGYILPTQAPGSIPLYRLLYPFVPGLHHWTIDANEYNTLITPSYGWIGEGGSGFVIP